MGLAIYLRMIGNLAPLVLFTKYVSKDLIPVGRVRRRLDDARPRAGRG